MKKKTVIQRGIRGIILGFPLLYCFNQTFCCYSELRDQSSTLTNLPPKEKASGSQRTMNSTKRVVCLPGNRATHSKQNSCSRETHVLMEQERRKKAPRIFPNQGAEVILDSYGTNFSNNLSKNLMFPVNQHGQNTQNVLFFLSTSMLTTTTSISSWTPGLAADIKNVQHGESKTKSTA